MICRHKEEVHEHEEAEKHRQEEAAELQRRLAYAEAQVTTVKTVDLWSIGQTDGPGGGYGCRYALKRL